MDKKSILYILGTIIGFIIFMLSMIYLEFNDMLASTGIIGAMLMGHCSVRVYGSKFKTKMKK